MDDCFGQSSIVGRFEAFSDGVFWIAITLLVLDVVYRVFRGCRSGD